MSCSTAIITTIENNHTNDDALSNSCFQTLDDQQRNSSLRSSRNDSISESVWFFKKYLLTKNQNNMDAKINVEINRKLEFPWNNFRRPPSLLEQVLLPQLQSCGEVEATPSNDKTSKQLTIFFNGVINVYNNIPVDKAQAIMRLAGESSLLKPVVAERPKPDVRKPSNKSKLRSASKLRAGIPMARRYSLQCFLEKRRDRIISKSPYALPREKQAEEDNEADKGKGLNEENRRLLPDLSPFPSRLGYFSLNSSHQG
ncbi:protein TIFY 10A-like [Rosa rugosa]|uniref:protein TIFY 10A-like n=1 Tax=Rosa rugosa TaxID=74645 RepID=UPI002B40533C|nr:protein TIFY 10A-like [Rosa rugosa]